MENLNKRQIEFVRLLLEEKEYRPIQHYADRLEVSDKTLQEDIKIIRTELKKYGGGILAKTGRGILLDESVRDSRALANDLHDRGKVQKWGTAERRNNILKNLLLQSGTPTSVQKLSDYYYVGKASIVNDLKYVEEWMGQFHLSLEKTKKGTQIVGREKDIREAITRMIHLDEVTLQNLLELFLPDEIAFVESLLEELELEKGSDTSDIYYKNMLTHILICIQRVRDGKKVSALRGEKEIGPKEHKQYHSALNISKKIKERYGIDIGEEETFYIYQYISSLATAEQVPEWTGETKDRSNEVAMALTAYMADILDVEFTNEELLLRGLLMHIRPLLNRLEYHIKIANPLLEEMQMSYPQMLGICQIVCKIIGKQYGIGDIGLDEIANIATYYQTMMVKQTMPLNVLVVCHSGYGTSQLLSARLKQEFSNFHIIDVIPFRKLGAMDMDAVDFVISTVPVQLPDVPYLIVSSLLTNRDISSIRNHVYMIEQKNEKKYQLLERLLTEPYIAFSHENCEKGEGRHICTAALSPRCIASVWENKTTSTKVFLTLDKSKQKLKFDIWAAEEESQKELLRELYRFSMEDKTADMLLACRTKEEVRHIWQGRIDQ